MEAIKKTIKRIGVILVLIAILAGVVGIIYGAAQLGIIRGFGLAKGEVSITSTTIRNSFNDIAELATEEYRYAGVGKFAEGNAQVGGVDIPLTGKSFLVTYEGEVKAGIANLGDVGVDLNESTKTVTITPPPVEVLSSQIFPESIETYDQSLNPFNQITVQDVANFQRQLQEKGTTEAIEGGLLERAQNRVNDILTAHVDTILRSSGNGDYKVVVEWQE